MGPILRDQAKRTSRAKKAGLIFPVARLERFHRQKLHHVRMSAFSPIFLTGVVEYLVAELLDLAGVAAQKNKKKRISPRHLLIAIALDQEFSQALSKVMLPGAGIFPKPIPDLSKIHKKATIPKTKVTKPKHKLSKLATKPSKLKPQTKKVAKGCSPSTLQPRILPPIKEKIKVLSERCLFLGQKLTIIKGDLLSLPVDAIIHPTNGAYFLGGLIGTALKNAGGLEFQKEIDKLLKDMGALPTAGASICPAHNIGARFIIHCNGPNYHEPDSLKLLNKTVKSCLKVAESKNLHTLAIPSIGSGKARFPKRLAAETILHSIQEYFVSVMASSLVQIYFVLFDSESVRIYNQELAKLFDTPAKSPK